jgi:hypothetical protein
MIDVVGAETAQIFSRLCRFADEQGYDRYETIDMFCDMFQAIIDNIDADEYDPNNRNYLS